MPLYEYACTACGEQFEKIQKFSDLPLTECPKCKGALKKLLSSSAIQFKGTGWYVTDYGHRHSVPESAKSSGGDGSNGDKVKAPEGAKKEAGAAKDPAPKNSASKDSALKTQKSE